MSGSTRYTVLSLLSVLLVGSSFPVVVHSIEACGAGSVLTSVYGVAALVTFVFVAWRHGFSSALSVPLSAEIFTRAVLFLGQSVPLYVALEVVDRGFLGGVFLCFFLWPVFALFYVKWLTNVKVARELTLFLGATFMILALGVEFFEQAVVGLAMPRNITAYILALIAANSCALYVAVTRRFGSKGKGEAMTPVFCLLAAMSGVALTIGNPDRHVFVSSGSLVLVGGAIGAAQVLWDASVRRGNAFVASVIACCTPWIAILSASFFMGIGLVDNIYECGSLLGLAMMAMASIVMSPRSRD